MIILLTESDIGFHSKIDLECKIIPMAFVPQVIMNENGELKPYINLSSNKHLSKYIKEYKKGSDKFYIGFDLDENGEFMAHALREYLISSKIDDVDILRIPLTEDGYIVKTEFLDISDYIKFRYYQQDWTSILKQNKLENMSIFEIFSLKFLMKGKGKDLNLDDSSLDINFEGTNTITFITNSIKDSNE